MSKFTFLIFFLFAQTSLAQLTEILTGLDSPTRIHVNGDFLYYAEDHSVSRINLSDNNATPELIYEGFENAGGVAVKDNLLFVADFDTGNIWKIDLSVEPHSAVVLCTSYTPNNLEIDGDFLYYSDNNINYIRKVNIYTGNDTNEETVVSENDAAGLDIHEGYMYYTYNSSYIYRMDLNDEEADHIFVGDLVWNVNAVRFHNGYLYTASPAPRIVMRYDFTNEEPNNAIELLNVDDGLTFPTGLAIHNDILYIASGSRIFKYETSLSTEDNSLDNLTVFPNPATTTINIKGLLNTTGYKLYNTIGEQVLSGSINTYNASIDISKLSSGMYVLNLSGTTNFKIVKN